MESFSIKSASGVGILEFFDRLPADPNVPIEGFWTRITDLNISAAAEVYAGYANEHPALLFVEMAQQWRGWPEELHWRSLEGELSLHCTQDRAGHVSIRVDLRSGPMEWNWSVHATIMSEAGQLDEMARRAVAFFGQPT
ncbi:MAG: DUF6228 family protein [Isosphaeraceae bacterium]|nr:DUF6228 family protein [Isosphaeraceae bacterium]